MIRFLFCATFFVFIAGCDKLHVSYGDLQPIVQVVPEQPKPIVTVQPVSVQLPVDPDPVTPQERAEIADQIHQQVLSQELSDQLDRRIEQRKQTKQMQQKIDADRQERLLAFARAFNTSDVCHDDANDWYFIRTSLNGQPPSWYIVHHYVMSILSNETYVVTMVGQLSQVNIDHTGVWCIY